MSVAVPASASNRFRAARYQGKQIGQTAAQTMNNTHGPGMIRDRRWNKQVCRESQATQTEEPIHINPVK